MSNLHQPLARGFPPVSDQDARSHSTSAVSIHHHHQQHPHGFRPNADVSHDTPGSSSATVAELANLIPYEEVASNSHPNSTAMRALVTFLRDLMQTQSLYHRWTEPRFCPLSYCSEVLDSPYALIQHVLSCPQLATGQVECWRWQDWLESSAVGQEQWQSNPSGWKGLRHELASRGRSTTPRGPNRRKHSSTPPGRGRIPTTAECQRSQGVGLQIPNLEELSRFLTKPQLDLICHGLEDLGGTADPGGCDDGQSMDLDMDVSTCTSPSVLSLDYGDFSYPSSRHSMQQDYQSMTTAYSDIDAQSHHDRSSAIHDADCDIELEVDHPMMPFWPTPDPHRMPLASQRPPCPPLRTGDLGGTSYSDQQYLMSPQSPFGCVPRAFSAAQPQPQLQPQHQHAHQASQRQHLSSHPNTMPGCTGSDGFPTYRITHPFNLLPHSHASAMQPPAHQQLATPNMGMTRRNSIGHFTTPSFQTRHASIDEPQSQPQLRHAQPQATPQPQAQTSRRASLLPTGTTPTPAPAPAPTSAPTASDDLMCDECQWKPRGVKENLRGYLRKHKNVHKNLKHACDVGGCSKSFSRLDNLKAHKKDKHPGVGTAAAVDEGSSRTSLGSLAPSVATSSATKRRDDKVHRGPGWAGPQRAMLWSSMQM